MVFHSPVIRHLGTLPAQPIGQVAGRLGSPAQPGHRVATGLGTRSSSASRRPGASSASGLRHPPLRRVLPKALPQVHLVHPGRYRLARYPSSRATMLIPRCPSDRASAANVSRRCRSSRCANFAASNCSSISTTKATARTCSTQSDMDWLNLLQPLLQRTASNSPSRERRPARPATAIGSGVVPLCAGSTSIQPLWRSVFNTVVGMRWPDAPRSDGMNSQ